MMTKFTPRFEGFREWFMKFRGKEIKPPIYPEFQPQTRYIGWNVREVLGGLHDTSLIHRRI